MPEISNLQVVVGYDDSAVGSGVGHTSSLFPAIGGAALAAGAAIAAGLAVGVKAAGDLQQSVANISTIKPEIDTSAVFGALNEMSTRIPATAAELGDSLYNVFSSMDVGQADALALVETFAKGAAGAGTSAETFGTAAMGVMNAYGLSAKDASAISDMFFDTINKGVVTGDELAASLGPVTQSAKAAGVEWRDLGPMIAAVTKEGGPAAQNMNNLNNLFQKFTTTAAQTAMNKMGIATTDAAGKFRAVPDVLTDLKAHLATLTQAEAAAALQDIFPDAQARIGAQTLMSQIDFVNEALKTNQEASGSTAAAYEKMSATFNSQSKLLINNLMAVGTAIGAEVLPMITPLISAFSQALPAAFASARFAGELVMTALDDIAQVFQGHNMQIEVNELLDSFGLGPEFIDGIYEVIRQAGDAWRTIGQVFAGEWSPDASIDPIVNAIGQIALVVRDQVIPAMQQLGEAFGFATAFLADHLEIIAGIAAAWATFTIITTVAGWISGAIAAFSALSGAIAASGGVITAIVAVLGGPVTLVILAVAAVVGLLTAAWIGNWGDIQGKTAMVVAWLQTNIPIMIDTIMEIAVAVAEAAVAFATWASETATTVATWVADTITAITTWVSETQAMFIAWGVAAQLAFDATWLAIETAVTLAWTTITAAFVAGILAIQTLWQAGWDALTAIVTAAWNLITPENQARIAELLVLFGQLWTLAGQLWTVGTTALLTIVTGWWAAIVKLWTTTTTAITTIVTTWWTAQSTLWTTQTALVTTTTTTWWTAITTLWATTTAAILATVTVWWTAISTAWTTGTKAVTDVVTPWWETLKTLWATALKTIGDAVGAKWAEIVTATTGLFTTMKTAFDDAVKTLGDAAGTIGTAVVDGIVGAINTGVGAVAAALIEMVKAAIKQMLPFIPGASGGGGGGGGSQTLSYNPSNTPAGEIDNSSRASFARTAYPLALQAANGDAKFAQRLIASAISENGTVGSGGPLGVGFNFGGIKGTGTAGSGNYGTWESVNGARVNQNDNFAAYNNPQEGFNAVPAFIQQHFPAAWARYQQSHDAAQLYQDINAGGYATNPNWHNDIEQIVNTNVAPNIPSGPPMNPALMTKIPLGSGTGTGLPGGPLTDKWGEIPMTMEEITKAAPVMGAAVQAAGLVVDQSLTGAGATATTQGALMVSATADSAGNVTRIYTEQGQIIATTVTNTTGQIVGQWSATGSQILSATLNALGGQTTAFQDQSGAVVSIVTDANGQIVGRYAQAGAAIVASTTATNAAVLTSVGASGALMITASTDALGNVSRIYTEQGQVVATTVTNTTGQIVSQWSAAGEQVVSATLNALGGQTTIFQDQSGQMVAVVTDATGQVVGRYAEMAADTTAATVEGNAAIIANVQATSQEMISQTTDQFGNVMRIYQDANGQITQTISDASGQNLSIWKQSADTMTKTTVDGQAQMLSTVKNSMGGTTAIYKSSAGEIVTIITDASGKIISEFKRAADGAKPVEESFKHLGDTVKNLKPPDLSGFVSEFKKVEKAANKAADAIDTVEGKGGKKSGGGKDNVFGKAAGGPVPFGQPVLVGEEGPEMFVPYTSGRIVQNSRLSMGGGGDAGPIQYHVIDFKIDDNLAERIFLTGRDISIKRGTVSV